MADNLFRCKSSDLSHLDDLVVMRSSNPKSFTYLGFSNATGFSGGICLNLKELSLEECARRIDAAAADPNGDAPFLTITDGFPDPFLQHALLLREPVNGYDKAQVKAVRDLILKRVPDRQISIIQHGENVMEWLDYFSSGDREARAQAAFAYPLTKHLIRDSDILCGLVDARKPIADKLQEVMDLDPEAYRVYAGIEANLSAEALSIENNADLRSFMSEMQFNRHLSWRSACHIRQDQIPKGRSEIFEMNKVVRWAEHTANVVSAGMKPFSRLLRRIRPDQWKDVACRVNAIIPEREARDFIRTVSRSISYAVAAESIARAGIDVPSLASSANKLWAKEDIEEAERLRLDAAIKVFEGMTQHADTLSSIVACEIGENLSLKDLKEFQARWHHVRHTLDNKVLSIKEDMEWPPLIGSFESEGYTFRELHKSADLNDQGRRERHCVGGYSSIILSATKTQTPVIFSIEKEDRVVSTVEMHARIEEEYHGNKIRTRIGWSVNQNKAARNESPGAEGKMAAGLLRARLEKIPSKEMFAYLQGVQSNAGNLKDRLQSLITRSGCNILNEDLPTIGITTYDEVMPKALRAISASDWMARISKRGGDPQLEVLREKAETMLRMIEEIDIEVSPAGPGE